jgi:hypothetical protein
MPRRTISPPFVLSFLRAAVGSPPHVPLHDEDAATLKRPFPKPLVIDAGAWVAWCLAGLHVWGRVDLRSPHDGEGKGPSWMEVISAEAERVTAVLAMMRTHGNLTHAAERLRFSRRALRQRLKAAGMHPWPAALIRSRRDEGVIIRAANGLGALAVVQALSSILERAEVLLMTGLVPPAAIVQATTEHQPGPGLLRAALAAWEAAVGSDEDSSDEDGGRP